MGSDKRSRRRDRDRDRDRDYRDRDRDKDRDRHHHRRRKSRSPSSSSSSSSSSRSSHHQRSKKIKKPSTTTNPNIHELYASLPPSPFPMFNPFLASMAPPPPAPVPVITTTKINKAKQTNIFKLLPQIGWSPLLFCNTIIDPNLFGIENYEEMIHKMWKRFERRVKALGAAGTDRVLRKLVPEGIAMHEKTVARIKEKARRRKAEEEKEKEKGFSDFDILKAYYEKKPVEEIQKMVGPENTVDIASLSHPINQ